MRKRHFFKDSLIINDFIEKGFKAYISSSIKLEYVCRSSFLNLLRLFNTYGYVGLIRSYFEKIIYFSKTFFRKPWVSYKFFNFN